MEDYFRLESKDILSSYFNLIIKFNSMINLTYFRDFKCLMVIKKIHFANLKANFINFIIIIIIITNVSVIIIFIIEQHYHC